MKIILVFVCLFIAFLIFLDKKNYNNGICTKCGGKLYHEDTDSQGGKMWVCDSCKTTLWTSWIDGDC